MSLFVSEDTIRIYVQGDKTVSRDLMTEEYIEVKAELSGGEFAEFQKLAISKVVMKNQGKEMEIDPRENAESAFHLISKVITGWSEKNVPTTMENIKKMHHLLITNLEKELNEMYGIKKRTEKVEESEENE